MQLFFEPLDPLLDLRDDDSGFRFVIDGFIQTFLGKVEIFQTAISLFGRFRCCFQLLLVLFDFFRQRS